MVQDKWVGFFLRDESFAVAAPQGFNDAHQRRSDMRVVQASKPRFSWKSRVFLVQLGKTGQHDRGTVGELRHQTQLSAHRFCESR